MPKEIGAKAAPVYQRSNDLQAKLSPYESAKIDAQLGKTLSAFAQPYVLRTGGDTQSPTPVFVIGQAALRDHFDRNGHIRTIPMWWVWVRSRLKHSSTNPHWPKTPASPADLARIYRSEMPHPATGYRSFVDKMPSHYLFVGFLAEAFPTAKFVHVQRDPREVAVSMWEAAFPRGKRLQLRLANGLDGACGQHLSTLHGALEHGFSGSHSAHSLQGSGTRHRKHLKGSRRFLRFDRGTPR